MHAGNAVLNRDSFPLTIVTPESMSATAHRTPDEYKMIWKARRRGRGRKMSSSSSANVTLMYAITKTKKAIGSRDAHLAERATLWSSIFIFFSDNAGSHRQEEGR